MFKKNVGQFDRTVRLILGGILTLLGLFALGGLQGSSIGIYTAILGIALLITGLFNFCMLYALLGFSTRKKEVTR